MKFPSGFFLLVPTLVSLMGCSMKSRDPASYAVTPKFNLDGPASPTEFRIVMGTRTMVASTLEDIFGKTSVASGGLNVQDVTSNFVLSQPASWGGPCDPYANSHPVPHAGRNGGLDMVIETPNARGCSDKVFSQSSMLPSGSTSRLAWTIRACDRIVSSDAAIRFAATQSGYPANSSLNTPPSEQSIRSVFDIFHPGIALSTASFGALKGVVDEANRQFPNTPEAWRFLMLTLCSSPGWQML